MLWIYLIRAVSRSREGAWIEISSENAYRKDSMVAPARERGLKSKMQTTRGCSTGRSREGAWIEIQAVQNAGNAQTYVAPARERGLKCRRRYSNQYLPLVAPARERGLK